MASTYFRSAARDYFFSFRPHMGLKSAPRLLPSATSAGAISSRVPNITRSSVGLASCSGGSLFPLNSAAATSKLIWSLSLASRSCMPLSHGTLCCTDTSLNSSAGFVYKSNNASDEVSSRLHGKTDQQMIHCSQISHAQMLTDKIFRFQNKAFSSSAGSIQRNSSFSILNSDDVFHFKEILGDKNVVQDDRLLSANVDWMRKYKGSSQLLLLPRTTEEVSQVLHYCNSRRLAVVPQGGNTGLVGGSVPLFDEVIVNLSSLSKIISFDKVSGILVCEAGCILENLDTFLANEGFMMPLDLGAKGSCQIGGNISTNAGGLRLIRYGSLHGNVLGLEVVLADGTILDMLKTLRKDNTGFDLKHLFIGSEGSLGIVTKISILTPPRLASTNLAFLACKDYVSCKKLLTEAKRALGEVLSAFEFLDRYSMDMVLTHLEGVRHPFPTSMHDFYVIIETTSSDQSFDKSKLETFLEQSCERELISDGVVAQDTNQASSFWRIREGITEALTKAGAVYKYDLSLPVEYLYSIVEEMRSRLGKSAKVLGYGHLGDGNLHLNISTSTYDDNILLKIEPFVYEWTSKYHGSISAEHGVGLMKADKIHYSKSPETVHLMAALKRLIDPNGILNPYKVLPDSYFSHASRG